MQLDIASAPRPDPPAPDPRPSLAGSDRAALGEALRAVGVPDRQVRMRTAQLWRWLYVHGVRGFDEMSDVSKSLRADLEAAYTLDRDPVTTEQISTDGTRKWLISLPGEDLNGPDGPIRRRHEVETVYIPESDRGTLCVSSQVGCTLKCTFCHTGTQALVRNLTAAEIVGQYMTARDRTGDWPGAARPTDGLIPQSDRTVTNIVMMGMGEPLYNFENVRDALDIVSDNEGLGLSKRRVTLSTSGVVPMIARTGDEIGCMLAISLHAVRDDLRDELVPINRKYPIKELMEACRAYPGASNARRITFEYVMLKGVNDSDAEARDLVRLLQGVPAKINLIPFNPWPGTPYECSSWETIERFADIVNRAGYASPIRTPRGRDIFAACGQLKSASEKMRASEKRALQLAHD